MAHPPLLFYAYASPDEQFVKELEKHLSSMEEEGLIRSWNARMIQAGEDRNEVIGQKLHEAEYILFLVSSDFFRECKELIPRALQQYKEKRAKIIPVVVRAVDWKRSPFGALDPCPRNGTAVKSWSDQDEAWLDVVTRIREVIEKSSAAGPSGGNQTASPPAPDRNALFDALCKLLPGQFEQVLFLLNVPYTHLSTDGPRSKAAIELIRLQEQTKESQGLQQLADALRKAAPTLAF